MLPQNKQTKKYILKLIKIIEEQLKCFEDKR